MRSCAREESCNTISCDRDCKLDIGPDWSPCDMACDGGLHEGVCNRIIPIRDQGKCPKEKPFERYGQESCNTRACIRDEICIAGQDLVLDIDGNSSLKYGGFKIVQYFSADVSNIYQAEYCGHDDMKIGIVLYALVN